MLEGVDSAGSAFIGARSPSSVDDVNAGSTKNFVNAIFSCMEEAFSYYKHNNHLENVSLLKDLKDPNSRIFSGIYFPGNSASNHFFWRMPIGAERLKTFVKVFSRNVLDKYGLGKMKLEFSETGASAIVKFLPSLDLIKQKTFISKQAKSLSKSLEALHAYQIDMQQLYSLAVLDQAVEMIEAPKTLSFNSRTNSVRMTFESIEDRQKSQRALRLLQDFFNIRKRLGALRFNQRGSLSIEYRFSTC